MILANKNVICGYFFVFVVISFCQFRVSADKNTLDRKGTVWHSTLYSQTKTNHCIHRSVGDCTGVLDQY